MRFIHTFFSRLGLSLGGHKACVKHGCEKYCGYLTSEAILFHDSKRNR